MRGVTEEVAQRVLKFCSKRLRYVLEESDAETRRKIQALNNELRSVW